MSRRQRRARLERRRHASVSRRAAAAGGLAVAATLLSSSVAEASSGSYQVTTTADNGTGSLRAAITALNADSGPNTITFQSGLSGSIDLASSLPNITSPLTITGPGARTLTVDGDGHQIFYFKGTATQSDAVSGLTLTGGDPGAVDSSSPALTLTGDTLSGNTDAYGGAVFAIGHLNIDDSTISGNTAMGSGGIDAHAGLSLTSSTVSGNTATEFASGGIGLYYDNTVPANPLTVTDSTIVYNHATAADSQGGGVNIDGGSVPSATFKNTIVAGNAAAIGPDINSPSGMSQVVPTASFSLIQDPTGSGISLPNSTDLIGDLPQLAPLENNGGQTDTMMPRLDSPVVDAGKAFGQTTDQRGLTRPVDLSGIANAPGGDGTDIGAVEIQNDETTSAIFKVTNGRIVLTSSITGSVVGQPGYAHYGASKAAMLGFMRSAALEVADAGITVNSVLPGNIRTPGFGDLGEEHQRGMLAAIPLGILGEPEDVGWAVRFLASPEARYITGQTLIIDGGQVLPESA